MYPRMITNLALLRENINRIVEMAHAGGCTCALVTKCVCAAEPVIAMMNETEADFLADSRVDNLARIKSQKPRYLLRIAQPWEAEGVITHTEISQQSELVTIRLLGREAKKQNRPHKIVLMADMGDLREGVFYQNKKELFALAHAVKEEPMLELFGLGVNLTCFGGIVPDETNLTGLVTLAEELRQETGLPIPFVSGGNSSSLPMLMEGRLPKGINNLRIGEGYLLGNETVGGTRMPGFHGDAFVLQAQLAEVKNKPSKPIGTSGLNAFGEAVSFEDRGEMLRGICALGRQDTVPDGLTPIDGDVEILGASSDHLILNLTRAGSRYQVGDPVAFTADYGALLRAFTGGYIKKEYIN